MGIDSLTLDSQLQGVGQIHAAQMMQRDNQVQFEGEELSEKDAYIPSNADYSSAIPSSTYGPNAMMRGDLPPVGGAGEASGIDPESQSTSSSSFMSALSNAFRANEDSIEMVMEELGLSIEDLTSEENMETLATAMNAGAENLGVPTVDNMDEVVASLMEDIDAGTYDEDIAAASSASESSSSDSSSSSSSDSETTYEVVTINGVTYLETTVTENGVETTTRTVLSGTEEA